LSAPAVVSAPQSMPRPAPPPRRHRLLAAFPRPPSTPPGTPAPHRPPVQHSPPRPGALTAALPPGYRPESPKHRRAVSHRPHRPLPARRHVAVSASTRATQGRQSRAMASATRRPAGWSRARCRTRGTPPTKSAQAFAGGVRLLRKVLQAPVRPAAAYAWIRALRVGQLPGRRSAQRQAAGPPTRVAYPAPSSSRLPASPLPQSAAATNRPRSSIRPVDNPAAPPTSRPSNLNRKGIPDGGWWNYGRPCWRGPYLRRRRPHRLLHRPGPSQRAVRRRAPRRSKVRRHRAPTTPSELAARAADERRSAAPQAVTGHRRPWAAQKRKRFGPPFTLSIRVATRGWVDRPHPNLYRGAPCAAKGSASRPSAGYSGRAALRRSKILDGHILPSTAKARQPLSRPSAYPPEASPPVRLRQSTPDPDQQLKFESGPGRDDSSARH